MQRVYCYVSCKDKEGNSVNKAPARDSSDLKAGKNRSLGSWNCLIGN